jgi:hypothetical protein
MNSESSLRLPEFIHVGPPRTGTTWLHEVLSGHAALPTPKETRFFDDHYHRGIEWYSDKFRACPSGLPAGEFYPGYFANPVALHRIRHHIPDCKIICTFRDPALRLYSLWRIMRTRRLVVEPNFDRFWRLLVARGCDLPRYAAHLQWWQRVFGGKSVLVLFYEDLNAEPQAYLDVVCDFVGLDRVRLEDSPVGRAKVHEASRAAGPTRVSQFAGSTYAWLVEHGARRIVNVTRRKAVKRVLDALFVERFDPLDETSAEEIRLIALRDTEKLERMTGRDLSTWKPRGRERLTYPCK